MTATALRHLALSVDEPQPDVYRWILMESEDAQKTWFVLDSSDEEFDTYQEAWDDGAAALRALGDGERGPRTESTEDEAADPVVESGPGVDH